MSARTLLCGLGLVLCMALASCSTTTFGPGGTRTLRCTGANCDVQVFVTCSAPAPCVMSVDNETVQVPRGNAPTITWQLQTAGYTFPDNAIVFATGGSDFVRCHPEANGRRFMCLDKHELSGRFKYTITVNGSPAVPPLDPWIVND